MRRAGLLALALGLAACQPRVELEPTSAPAASGASIVVRSEGGLPTKPAIRTPTPSPTRDLLELAQSISTVAPIQTRTPVPARSPTPTLAPPNTSTPRPTATFPSGSFLRPATPTPRPSPTRTPRPTVDPIDVELTQEARATTLPTEIPIDDLEPNDDRGRATSLPIGDFLSGVFISGTGDVDVFAIPMGEAGTTLVVSLGARTPGRYRVEIESPSGRNVGRQRFDGTSTLRSVAEVGSETGTYYVFVRGVGAPPPEGPYSISADFLAPTATPTALE